MSCEHLEREYWDCGCKPSTFEPVCCAYCGINSKCLSCGLKLEARPNIIDDDDIPEPTEIGVKMAKSLAAQGIDVDPSAPITSLEISSNEGPPITIGLPDGRTIALGDYEQRGPEPEQPKKKRATIAKRSKEERDSSDSTCTPKWFADFLYEIHGPFDIDPCSNPRSHIIAHWAFSLEKGLDGLRLPWRGSSFKNNPFSKPLPWQLKAQAEMRLGRCTELVELCKFDPSTEWWSVLTEPITTTEWSLERCRMPMGNASIYFPDLWILKDRMQYDEDPLIIEKRRLEYEAAVARGEKPKGHKTGKSSNNFCSAIVHHRLGNRRLIELERYATLWVRG